MLKDIGEMLRRQREARGLSLRDAQIETKIRTRYLEALESGDFAAIPGEVYAKGFLKTYGEFLGLDGAELLRMYREATGVAVPQESPKPVVARGAPPLEMHVATSSSSVPNPSPVPFARPTGGTRWGWAAGGVVVFAGLVATSLYWIGTASLRPAETPSAPPAAEPPPPPAKVEPPPPPVKVSPVKPNGNGNGQPADLVRFRVELPAGDLIQVEFRTQVDCWYRTVWDGQHEEEKILPAGGRTTWTARDKMTIRLGNPRLAELTVNGVPLEGITANEPRTIELVRQAP